MILWPQAGEMRSLWKGTTECWTNDMPQDDTWEPSRHHSHINSRSFAIISLETQLPCPLYLWIPVASTEHECRDPHLLAVSHTENAEEEGRCVVLGFPKSIQRVHSNHHDDSSGATESRRQGRNHGNQQVHTAGFGVRRWEATFQPEDGGNTPNWIYCKTRYTEPRGSWKRHIWRNSQPRTKWSKQHSDWNRRWRGCPRSRNCWRWTWSQPVNEDKPEKRLLGGIKKTKTLWERWYETIKEEEKW